MFSRLSRTASQYIDFNWDDISPKHGSNDGLSSREYILPSDVEALSELSFPLAENALEAVSGVCGRMFSPLYHFVESTMTSDVEKLVQSLHEADPAFAEGSSSCLDDDDSDIYVITIPENEFDDTERSAFPSKSASQATSFSQPGSSPVADVMSHARPETVSSVSTPHVQSIPSIVITFAPPQAPEKSAWVPIQDTCFGQRLTVPTHSALNAAHPPMVAASYSTLQLHSWIRGWTYKHGHWCAVAPALDEQECRGIFSRPIGVRRRTSLSSLRKRAGRDTSHVSRQSTSGRAKRDS